MDGRLGIINSRISELMFSIIQDYKHNSDMIQNCLVWNGSLLCESILDILGDKAKCLFVEYSSESFVKLSKYQTELQSNELPANYSIAYIPRDADSGDETADYRSYALHPATYPLKYELIIINGKSKGACTRYARNLVSANALIVVPNAEEIKNKLPKDMYLAEFTDKLSQQKLVLMSEIQDILFHVCERAKNKYSDLFEVRYNFELTSNSHSDMPSILFIHKYNENYLANQYSELLLSSMGYEDQRNYLLSKYSQKSDFYSYQFRQLGCRVEDLIINCPELQHSWALERESDLGIEELLYSQVKAFSPDVIFLDDIANYDYQTIVSLKSKCKLLVGEIYNPPSNYHSIAERGLVLGADDELCELVSGIGINMLKIPFLFDNRVQESPANYANRRYPVSVLITNSTQDIDLARYLSDNYPNISIFTYTYGEIADEISAMPNYLGNAVASKLYKLMSESKIVICNNWKKIYEVNPEFSPVIPSGCGALLLCSYDNTLPNIFEIGEEIITYRTNAEALAMLKYYAEYSEESIQISSLAYSKVQQDYSYTNAANLILESINNYLHGTSDIK